MVRIMKTFTTAVLFFSALSTVFGQEIGATADWSVFGSQPRYKVNNPGMLSSCSLSRATELELSLGWNERATNVAELEILEPGRHVWKCGSNYYLDDCQWLIGGKMVPFKNRFKPIKPPAKPKVTVTPCPCPTVTVDIRLPVHETFELVGLIPFTWIDIPPLPESPPPGMAIILVYDHGRPKWSYIPILNCVYQFGPNIGHDWKKFWPDVERGACITAAVYAGFGLSAGRMLLKPPVCVEAGCIMPKP